MSWDEMAEKFLHQKGIPLRNVTAEFLLVNLLISI